MIAKHWKLTLQKQQQRITLYVTTTDALIEIDLSGPESCSLIATARQYHRRAQNAAQNHRDLAIGALMVFAAAPPYDLSFEHIETAPEVPHGPPQRHVCADRGEALVPIWESCESEDDEFQ